MFGFLSKQQATIEIESCGVILPSTARRFYFYVAGDGIISGVHGDNKAGFMEFDIENVSATKPDTTTGILNDSSADVYGVETSDYLISARSFDGQTSNRLFDVPYAYSTGQYRGWVFNSTGVLSPASRKFRLRILNPLRVNLIGLITPTNNQGRTSTSNTTIGEVNLNLNQFPRLNEITLQEGWAHTITLRMDGLKNFELFRLSEYLNLTTINVKLPPTTKYITFGELPLITSVNHVISGATGCIGLYFGNYSPSPGLVNTVTSLTGVLDVSTLSNLKDLVIFNNAGLTGFTLPSIPPNQWRIFQITAPTATFATIPNSELENALTSSDLIYFAIASCNKVWTKNFGNAEISNSLVGLSVIGNQITGDFILTNAKLSLKDLRLGVNQTELNRFATINLSGLSGGSLTTLHLQGVECSNLTLPSSLPSLTAFQAYDNKLDIVTNPDIISKINGYTALNSLYLGNGSTSIVEINHFGQVSTNGLGANPILSGLTNAQTLNLNKCGFSGTLTLPNVAKVVTLNLSYNPLLTSINNLTSHTSTLQQLFTISCTGLTFSITSSFTSLSAVFINGSKVQNIDLSGKTTTGQMTVLASDCPLLETVSFSATAANNVIIGNGGNRFSVYNSPNLHTISNLDKVSYSVNTGTNIFHAYGCLLDITFPFGVSNFLPSDIKIEDNGMSVANVDASIDNIYVNRAKWSTYSTSLKLNIGGTNAAPTGTYQAPSGFVLESNDGTPVNAKEEAYVLVNNYGWTITMN